MKIVSTRGGATVTDGGLLDVRPITLPGFKLTAFGVTPIGKPSLDEWIKATQFAAAVEVASPYWVGDLLRYAESRGDWESKIDQAMSATGLARQTCIKLTTIARKVEEPERELAPSLSHAEEVAALPRVEQAEWLTKAGTEGWTKNELRLNIKAAKRTKVLDGRAVLEGQYRVILADPPWLYKQRNPTRSGALAKANEHYPGMTLEQICELPVMSHSQPDAVLFLYVTAPMLNLAFPVLDAWGFTYKTNMVWDKVLGNPGNYGIHVRHEHLIIGVRGDGMPDVPTPQADSVQTIRRSDNHSEKPEDFRQFITRHWTRGPYLELFGRKLVDGWTVFGNDPKLWKVDV